MVFVFTTGTMMNANSSSEETKKITTESMEVEEYFGCARDCVDSSLDATFAEAVDTGTEPSMSTYMAEYSHCISSNC